MSANASLAVLGAHGAHVDIDGVRHYRIAAVDTMEPFLVALASDSDHWIFVSSTGALTAGRKNPDCALFPYYTDDRLHDGWDQTGGKTLIAVREGERRIVWEPLSARMRGRFRTARRLAKSVYGNALRFEEDNLDLGLSFFCTWELSERFGFVRRAGVARLDDGRGDLELELCDGVQNLLPAGISRRFQLEYSTLADGYKKSELDAATGLGLFLLSSIPTDKAEPSESLRATTVWSVGLPGATHLLCSAQLDRFRDGLPLTEERDVRGRRGAYLLATRLVLPAAGRAEWLLCAEVAQDAADVAATLARLRQPELLRRELLDDVARGTRELARLVGSADGLSATSDERERWGHYSNTLYNLLRGGVPDRGHEVPAKDFSDAVRAADRALAERHAAFLAALPERLPRRALVERAAATLDLDLERLAREYLPLAFCRRHGDPSRPWNQFSITLRGPDGRRLLDYQGNWRDIFQNWEALGLSFPGLLEAMIAKFLDCSTADGHNPYRVTRSGFDWEVIDPADEWSFIGYWGDHQVIYLLKLLERQQAADPDVLPALLARRLFVYANVPYRIAPYEELLAHPQRTISFDGALDERLREQASLRGTDALLLAGADGAPVRASLVEKLLLVLLGRLAHYIAGAGIWMNTQRPEWNDANNALVGSGVSVVTLCYLRRYVVFLRALLAGRGDDPMPVAAEIAALAGRMRAALLAEHELARPGRAVTDADRRRLLDALGGAASEYRGRLYQRGLSGETTALRPADVVALCDAVLPHLDASIRDNRREDGLYHAYNLVSRDAQGGLRLRRLPEMLEGQVAVLSAGLLDPDEALALLDALRGSRLYREDQQSYLLYPDRALPRFLDKNVIPPEAVAASPLLSRLLERGDERIAVRDVAGAVHFHASFRNAALLDEALTRLESGQDGPLVDLAPLVETEREAVLALYERLFDHQSFTGRSGTFYKYEGLGCIYWHMVSKLRLAVQELLAAAARRGADGHDAQVARLSAHYDAIRGGLGLYKTPATYGAIPIDPHSHTPSFAGAQQPGMTGQVKEDILARLGDLGLQIEDGRLLVRTALLRDHGFLEEPGELLLPDADGGERRVEVPAGALAATLCGVPLRLHREGGPRIEVRFADGRTHSTGALELARADSAALLSRDGSVELVDVHLGLDRA